MKNVFANRLDSQSRQEVLRRLENFEQEGRLFGDGQRNVIRIFPFEGKEINVKSFKIPNAVNKIAYRFFRKSKAERSFLYANLLLSKGVGTPTPIGYSEETNVLFFLRSYYISEHLECDLTYRSLVLEPDYPQREDILRAFTRFTFDLHEKQIEFLDHSPGNTLIQLDNGNYKFFLVDLNRMNFRLLDFEARMKNFSRLTPEKEMVRVMANEYAKLYPKPEGEIFDKMWQATVNFQEKFQKKKALKKKLKFWKK